MSIFRLFALLALISSVTAHAELGSSPLHAVGDKEVWDRKANKVQLFGHAAVHQVGESILGDYILLDQNAHTLYARGNCVYIASDSVIHGEEMHFNLDTRTGSITTGRVSNEQFMLSGERINKLGEGHFQTHWGEYTTCRDCPGSWSLKAEDVDLEVGGYAYMSNVTARVKDASAFWMPYLVVPMKTRRQTGFLFPTFAVSESNGTALVLPFFWAFDRSADMTIAGGYYSNRGPRLEWEGRYALGDFQRGQVNWNYVGDQATRVPYITKRWALKIEQSHDLPWGIMEKFKYLDLTDNRYPYDIGDFAPKNEAVLPSVLSFSRANEQTSASVVFRRNRNLILKIPEQPAGDSSPFTRFDPDTVQLTPGVSVIGNSNSLFGTQIKTGYSITASRFTRAGAFFDFSDAATKAQFPNEDPDQYSPLRADPIRKADRVILSPYAYTTFRPGDVVSIVPSVQYFGYYYSFGHPDPRVSNLVRHYLLLQTDVSTQFEKIYLNDNLDAPRTKHLIRPLVTYSYIPYLRPTFDPGHLNESHPFLAQLQKSGFGFDSNDLIPVDATGDSFKYFTPIGNSLAVGATTQLITRNGRVDSDVPSYTRWFELSAGESFNLRELTREPTADRPRQTLSRFFSNLVLDLKRIHFQSTYYYYPYLHSRQKNAVSSTLTWNIASGSQYRLLSFDRSISLSHTLDRTSCANPSDTTCGAHSVTGSSTFSINDFIMPSGYATYDFTLHDLGDRGVSMVFQSPSQCWKLSATLFNTRGAGSGTKFDFQMNLTGTSFGGVTELANQAMVH